MNDTPRTETVVSKSVEAEDGAYLTEDLHILSRQLERDLAEKTNEVERAMYHIVEWRRYAGRAEKAEAELKKLYRELAEARALIIEARKQQPNT
jgi:hypothetical protein